MEDLERAIERADAVIVADYGKGFLTQPLADAVCRMARQKGKILTVDPHPHTRLEWLQATAIKPNRAEAFLAAGLEASDAVEPVSSDRALQEAARRLMERWAPENLLITLGEQGMLLIRGDGAAPYHTPTRAQAVFDVSGAGDTALAVFTLGLAAGGTPEDSAELANRASSIVVGKLGTATVTPAELLAGAGV
jgi:D-beta-D-heptose 7-phosphate kinase/D-beta-D-heptose 1-phosphate adenosyltransferase